MPSSRPHTIPAVIHLLRQIRPRSILDVGVGFGKWGHLFREYTDINAAENDPQRYDKPHWQVRLDGIEGHARYLTPMHDYLYDAIHVGDAREILPRLGRYDLIFLGDIIEHLDKPQGTQLLRAALRQADRAVIVSTPKFETHQGNLCGNPLEQHRSLWAARDFRKLPGASVKTVNRDTLLAVLVPEGAPAVSWQDTNRSDKPARRLLEETRLRLIQWLASDTPFILVDEEMIRGTLPHTRCWPFLEKDGVYWGPPASDEAALEELSRLQSLGAQYFVVVDPCRWWLQTYPRLAAHLQEHHTPCQEHPGWVAYKLAPP